MTGDTHVVYTLFPQSPTQMATFSNSKTVAQLSAEGQFISAIKNPKTGKLFLVDDAGNQLGAISNKCAEIITKKKSIDPTWVVSDFTSDEGEEFKMLHTPAENNNMVASTRPVASKQGVTRH